MPKLLIFAPCEKVIISQGESSASLISIFQAINIPVKGLPTPMPENAVLPFRWALFTEWGFLESDIGKDFEQLLECKDQKGENLIESLSPLHVEQRFMRSVASLEGLKFVPAGEYKLLASIRSKGEEVWQLQGEYPLLVNYLT